SYQKDTRIGVPGFGPDGYLTARVSAGSLGQIACEPAWGGKPPRAGTVCDSPQQFPCCRDATLPWWVAWWTEKVSAAACYCVGRNLWPDGKPGGRERLRWPQRTQPQNP